mmetsp:Transcript_4197/g.8491  ORF Transcript_4197/g.8491 Transcript_4197/m.8491 type:complete len:264 (+) Transcript_4197:313-1104(+)
MPQLLPHGWYSLMPPVLATMAWMSSLFQEGCDYAKITGSLVQALADSDAPYLEAGFGAYREPKYNTESQEWEIRYAGACLEYPPEPVDISEDSYWQLSKFLDFAASVLGGAGAFFLWFATACVFSPGTWRWTGYEVFCAALFQGLSFLWFRNSLCSQGDDTVCELSWGAKMDIVAASLWFATACLIFIHYPQAKDEWIDEEEADDDYEDDDEEYDDVDLAPPHTDEGHTPAPINSSGLSYTAGQPSGEEPGEERKTFEHAKIV